MRILLIRVAAGLVLLGGLLPTAVAGNIVRLAAIELRGLVGVLGDQHLRRGVVHDVLKVVGGCVGVDRGGRRTDDVDGQVGQNPLQSGGGGDGYSFGLPDRQGQQPRPQFTHPLAGLGPRERHPAIG